MQGTGRFPIACDGLPSTVRQVEDLRGIREQLAPGFGKNNMSAQPIEEPDSQVGFESLDVRGDRRLYVTQLLRSLGKAPVSGDRLEGSQVPEFHHPSSAVSRAYRSTYSSRFEMDSISDFRWKRSKPRPTMLVRK